MNAEVPNPFPAARGAANKWRGECIGIFAEVEQRLSTLLIRSLNVSIYATLKPAFPHLVGQKFERLRKLLALDGPMQRHAIAAMALLETFAAHDELRILLCHGELDVGITEDKSRLFLFTVRNFRHNIAGCNTIAFSQSEADARRNDLKTAADSLSAKLAELEKTLPRQAGKTAPPKP